MPCSRPRTRACPESARGVAAPARRCAGGGRGPRGGARHPLRRASVGRPDRELRGRGHPGRRAPCACCATPPWCSSRPRPLTCRVAAIRAVIAEQPGGPRRPRPARLDARGRSRRHHRPRTDELGGPGVRPAPFPSAFGACWARNTSPSRSRAPSSTPKSLDRHPVLGLRPCAMRTLARPLLRRRARRVVSLFGRPLHRLRADEDGRRRRPARRHAVRRRAARAGDAEEAVRQPPAGAEQAPDRPPEAEGGDRQAEDGAVAAARCRRRSTTGRRRWSSSRPTFVEYNKELEKKQKELTDPIFERVLGAIKRIAGHRQLRPHRRPGDRRLRARRPRSDRPGHPDLQRLGAAARRRAPRAPGAGAAPAAATPKAPAPKP